MVMRKDGVQGQSRRSGFGNVVAKHSPFPLISSYVRLLLKGVQKITTTMNIEMKSRKEKVPHHTPLHDTQ